MCMCVVCMCVHVCVNLAHGASNHPFAVEETYNPRWYPTGNCHTCYTSHTLRIRESRVCLAYASLALFPVEITSGQSRHNL